MAGLRHLDLQRAAVLHLAREVLQRRVQPEVVEQRGTQVARHAPHFVEHGIEAVQRHAQHRHHRGGLRRRQAQPVGGGLEHEFDRHQQLADAVVQFARQSRTLLFLRLHHALRKLAQLGIGLAMLADIEREPARRHQQDADGGDGADPSHGLADIDRGTGIEPAQRLFHIVEINAGADHPVPLGDRHHVAKLGRHLLRRRLFPQIPHRAAAIACGLDQFLDGQCALRIAHQPQVLPDQLRLARVHEVAALHVVQEEVAVGTVVEPRQRLHGGRARGGVVVTRAHHRCNGALREFHVVAQLHLLALEIRSLDQRAFMPREFGGLVTHGQRDAEHGHGERRNGEQQDLLTELHLNRG